MTELDAAKHGPQQLIRHYLAILWRRKGLVVATLTVTVLAAAYYSFQQPTIYQSVAEVHVRPSLLPSGGGTSLRELNLTDEALLARSVPVAEHAVRLLGEQAPATVLTAGLSVSPVQPGASILTFRYTATDPATAQRLAQGFATAYLEYRRGELKADLDNASEPLREQAQMLRTRLLELTQRARATTTPNEGQTLQTEIESRMSQLVSLEQRINELPSSENIRVGSIIKPATFPGAPSSPDHSGDLSLAILVGAALAAGLAILIDRLDERVRGREELEATLGAPVLAAASTVSERRNGRSPLVTLTVPDSPAAEAYRALRTSILLSKSEEPLRTFLVTSVDVDQAATVTSANLAVVLALAGIKTAIVAADLNDPQRLHKLFENRPELDGQVQLLDLADLLHGAERAERVARTLLMPAPVNNPRRTGESGQSLRAARAFPAEQPHDPEASLPEGQWSYPGDLLASEILPKVLADLRTRAEFVILDAPPLGVGVDATILASAADGVLLVARAGRTSRTTLAHAERELRRGGANLVGTVLYR